MKQLTETLSGIAVSVAAFFAARLGGWDMPVRMMFLLMGLDVLSGVLVALSGRSAKTEGGRFLSKAMFLGLSSKMMILLLIMLAVAMDSLMKMDGVARAAVIGFYSLGEMMSIVENAALLGVPFPKRLLAMLEKKEE